MTGPSVASTAGAMPVPPAAAAVVAARASLQVERGLDQRHVAERLREVADLPRVPRVVLLAEQPDVVAQRQQPLEQLPRRRRSGRSCAARSPARSCRPGTRPRSRSGRRRRPGRPRRRRAGCTGSTRPSLISSRWMVSTVDTTRGSSGGRKPDLGDQQHGRVQLGAAVVLGERAALGVVALLADLGVDLVAHRRATGPRRPAGPARPRLTARSKATQAITLECTKCRRGPRTSQMPSSGSVPVLLEEPQQRAHQAPGVPVEGQARLPAERDRVDHLAVHVELALAHRGVADPHRRRVLVAGQPVGLPFVEPALAGHAVHDLHVAPGPRRSRGPATPATARPPRCTRCAAAPPA